MKREDQLIEEAEFWLTYIVNWKKENQDPVPKQALILLDITLLKLKIHYLEIAQDKLLQGSNRSLH